MSWTIEDVDEHKKGLTEKQKDQWVRIANNTLTRGGQENSAIRRANGAIRTHLKSIFCVNADYTVRREERNGKKYIVVPVTMMVEGVHSGNHGPLYHSAEELGAAADAWNGVPVTISHPQSGGEYVSAQVPGILEEYGVGVIEDVRMDGDRLRAEAWIEEGEIKQKSPEALSTIDSGELMEVSAGLFSEDENVSGEWKGETYNAISRNHRPDHLALLPGEVGACSIDDGCGVRANKEGGKSKTMKTEKDEKLTVLSKEQYLADLIANAESGYREIMSLIQTKLDAMDTDLKSYYTENVYDDYFVYSVRSRDPVIPPKMYRRDYSVNDNGELTFAEEPTEVRKQVTYVTLTRGGLIRRTNNNNSKKEVTNMSDKIAKPCCEDAIDALIANEKTVYTAEAKPWLLTLKEEEIAKLVQNEVKKDPPVKTEPVVEANAETKPADVTANATPKFEKVEDFLESVPNEFKEQFSSGLRLHQEARTKMVKAILDNTEDVWTEDKLKVMEIETLENVFKSVVTTTVADYSLNGVETVEVNIDGEEPLLPPFATKKATA